MKQELLAKVTENDVKAAIKQLLDLNGIWHFYLLQSMGSYPGLPDMMAAHETTTRCPHCHRKIVTPGIFAIEAKKPTGKQSPKQVDFQADWERRYGKTYVVARSSDDVAEFMGLKQL